MPSTPSYAEDETVRLSRQFEMMMRQLAAREDTQPKMTVSEGVIALAGHRVRIDPISEDVVNEPGKSLSGARFDVYLDDVAQPRLTKGTVGTGTTADEARANAIVIWYMSFGMALFRSVAGDAPDFTHGSFVAYKGAMAVRGGITGGEMITAGLSAESLFDAIASVLPNRDGKFHSVHLWVAARPDGPIEGECWIDGFRSEMAARALFALPWLNLQRGVYVNQSYVLK